MRKRICVRMILALACWCMVGIAWGRIIYVKTGSAGANDGMSWASAYADLQSAMAADAAGDEIWVAAGTYKPTTGSNRDMSFVMQDGVGVYGGFAGTETSRGQRNPALNLTALSGDIGTPGLASDNTVCIVKGASNAVLDGFMIAGGNGSTVGLAGGMTNTHSNMTVNDCFFSGNNGDSGAVMNYMGAPVFTNCTFMNNNGLGISVGGGAMQCIDSSATLTNCTFSSNRSYVEGGAISIYSQLGRAPKFYGCTFTNNTADGTGVIPDSLKGGGAIYSESDLPLVSGCTFTGNSSQAGGAIHHHSDGVIKDCIFLSNNASICGGAIWDHQANASPKIKNCVFAYNHAVYGGGVHNYRAQMQATNCVFYGNSADQIAGAVYCHEMPRGPHTLTNCTIVGNTSGGHGGGVYINTPVNSTSVAYTNCIIWGNSAPQDPQIYNISASPNIKNCCIDGCFAGTAWNTAMGTNRGGNIASAPNFKNSSSPVGADGIWKTLDDGLRLAGSSPCVNAGAAAGLTCDILGYAYRGNPEIGAYEYFINAARRGWTAYR